MCGFSARTCLCYSTIHKNVRRWYIRWHLDGHSHIMSEHNFQGHQEWKIASPDTHALVCRSIHAADAYIENRDWLQVISTVECAHITCMTLAVESAVNEVYTRFARGYLAKLMLVCIDEADVEASQIPRSFWWAQHPEEKLLSYKFPWSQVDPLCVCGKYCGQSKPVAGHWCGICAHENPAKYTVGGLYALQAPQ